MTSNQFFVMLKIIILPFVAQIIICKKNKNARNKVGLVLPVISFAIALIFLLASILLGLIELKGEGLGSMAVILSSKLLIANIPTLVLYLIHFMYTLQNRQIHELEKMKLQDL